MEQLQWVAVTTKGIAPLPRSLHTAVIIKSRLFACGGWVPVVGEDGNPPTHETEWRCTNSLVCLNTDLSGSIQVW